MGEKDMLDMTVTLAELRPALAEGEEYRGEWRCPVCGEYHGYTYRRARVTRLRVCLRGLTVNFDGDGSYPCPTCGLVMQWVASAYGLSRILAARAR